MKIPKAIQNLIEAFERLPGIGSKTAARLTFYLLHVPEVERQKLGQAVLELGEKTGICERCFNICDVSRFTSPVLPNQGDPERQSNGSDGEVLCDICFDPNRDQTTICVVEDPLDLMAFERTGKYDGLYHVLQGVIAPLEHIGPEDLKIDELIKRVSSQPPPLAGSRSAGQSAVREVILATNPSLEGEATAMYVRQLIGKELGDKRQGTGGEIRVTRIARGIPTGGDLEYADRVTLTKALEGRQEY